MNAVPTTVTRGPDGALYVGQLTGFPFPVGGARIFRVVPGQSPTIYARGFTNIIDIDFAPDGTLYVLEIAHNSLLAEAPEGALLRVGDDGSKTVVADGLFFPGGLEIGSLGKLYVTNCGVCATDGEVWRITP
jgi:sugar lactone lactonase YvrE